MADLTDLQAAESVKIVGSNTSGVETNPVTVDNKGNLSIGIGDTRNIDAFDRLRVSNPDTIFENHFRWSKQPLLWSESLATGGTATHTPNSAAVTLGVTTSSGSSAIYQTKRYFPYNAGKSQLVMLTGIFGTGQTNTRKRYGYFDANDGVYFEQNGTTFNVVRRTATSGVVVDNAVSQASWNLDPMDGSGPSGLTLDITKAQVFLFDIAWLGTSRIRCGLVINGLIYYVHEFLTANILTTPSMRQAVLPIRAEITNTGAAGATSNLIIICQTVISEGGAQSYGIMYSASTGFTLRTITTAFTPIISIRLKSVNLASVARILNATGWVSTADSIELALIINPTTLVGSTFAVNPGGLVEIDTSALTMTGGQTIYSCFLKAAAGNESLIRFDNITAALNTWLGSDLAGTADIFTIAARNQTGTADVAGSITWLEMP